MSKFVNKNNNTEASVKEKSNNGKKTFVKKEKPKFVKLNVSIADSDFYANNIDSLYNLLDSISFNKVAIPVHIAKSEMFDNPQLKGTTVFGTVEKFNNDNTFTISVQESFAEKFTKEHVMSIRCRKDYATGDITYITSFNIVKGESIQSQYGDIEQAMLDKAEEGTE